MGESGTNFQGCVLHINAQISSTFQHTSIWGGNVHIYALACFELIAMFDIEGEWFDMFICYLIVQNV